MVHSRPLRHRPPSAIGSQQASSFMPQLSQLPSAHRSPPPHICKPPQHGSSSAEITPSGIMFAPLTSQLAKHEPPTHAPPSSQPSGSESPVTVAPKRTSASR